MASAKRVGPHYLTEIPLDASAGETVLSERRGRQRLFYCVGPHGFDNGGENDAGDRDVVTMRGWQNKDRTTC